VTLLVNQLRAAARNNARANHRPHEECARPSAVDHARRHRGAATVPRQVFLEQDASVRQGVRGLGFADR
jgi:hypothetical protein